jgi:hypothetical protein
MPVSARGPILSVQTDKISADRSIFPAKVNNISGGVPVADWRNDVDDEDDTWPEVEFTEPELKKAQA